LALDAPTAFFSYSREDSDFALRLAEDLKAAGAPVWLDQLDITPGQRWARAVQDALNNCPRMLVILSPSSVASTNVEDEVTFALEEHKTVIPILYRDCKVPLQLRSFQYIDFRIDYLHGLNVLLKTLRVEQKPAEPKKLQKVPRQTLAESIRLEDEKQIAREKDCGSPGEREPLTVAGQAPQRLRSEHPGVKKSVVFALCGLLAIALVSYFATVSVQKERQTPKHEVKSETSNARTSAESSPVSAATEKANTNHAKAEKRDGSKMTPENVFAHKAAEVRPLVSAKQESEVMSSTQMTAQGDAYFNGQGVAKDYKQAMIWYRKAAEASDTVGMVNLGIIYLKGYGVKKDEQQAFVWFRRAAEKGDPGGMVWLSAMYGYGWGVRKNPQQSFNWDSKAAEAGNAEAMYNLGLSYENGYVVAKDQQQSLTWLRKAADGGYPQAMTHLGYLYRYGIGVKQDSEQSIKWYEKGFEAGEQLTASWNLGVMYEKGDGVDKDTQRAVTWYRKAARLGDQGAKDALKRLGENPE
jgi:TPR repeat protein